MKSAGEPTPLLGQTWGRGTARVGSEKAGDLLPVTDFACLLFAGYFSLLAHAMLMTQFGLLAAAAPVAWDNLHRLLWIAAALAPFMLYEKNFAAGVSEKNHAALVLGHLRRLALLSGVLFVIAFAGRWLTEVPRAVMILWLGATILLTVSTRVLLAYFLQRRMREKSLAQTAGMDGAVSIPAGHSSHSVGPERETQVIAYVGGRLHVILLADRPIKHWNAVLKSGSDLVLSSLIVIMILPVIACIALAIKLTSPGPVLYKQRRHGFNNREFDIYKFRTMRFDSEDLGSSLQQTVRGDSRITGVGRFLRKWSLDELPQLLNVLEGDMSLVGPRPHAVNMRTEARLGHEIIGAYAHRHRVKPGITGWSQINGFRGATDTAEQLQRRIELDLFYIENWSLLLDLKILSLTSREVLRATNAF